MQKPVLGNKMLHKQATGDIDGQRANSSFSVITSQGSPPGIAARSVQHVLAQYRICRNPHHGLLIDRDQRGPGVAPCDQSLVRPRGWRRPAFCRREALHSREVSVIPCTYRDMGRQRERCYNGRHIALFFALAHHMTSSLTCLIGLGGLHV